MSSNTLEFLKPLSSNYEDIEISKKMQEAFLDYSMSVIVDRALPDVRDGLKPVHRRIIYAMYNNLKLYHSKPYRKSATIVGEVMGKFHPHGDSSIYDALVRLAQDFSMRYPLVDSHGNFGTTDGDGAAASRYTEARLERITESLVLDIDKETVDFIPNYDGNEEEPVVLPSRFPNLLVNGTEGIAVGMSSHIPPHNISEIIEGTLAYIDNPDIELLELMEYIKAPDMPTAGVMCGRSGVKKLYETGIGSFSIRSKYEIEVTDKHQIVTITEIPYQINKAEEFKKSQQLIKDKVLEDVIDSVDSTNRNGVKIVYTLKKNANVSLFLNNLFKRTNFKKTYSCNMLALVDKEPKVLPLKSILSEYLKHQVEVITRRTRYELAKAKEREHVVKGLEIAVHNIDEVISIIRNSDNDAVAQEELMARLNLSEKQAKVILDMQIKRLTKLGINKIEEELKELILIIERLEAILNDKQLVINIIKEDLQNIRAQFSDVRRTEISSDEDDIEDEDLIEEESIVITLTKTNYIKRLSSDTYKAQNRGGKGIKGMTTYDDDMVNIILTASTHSDILFFTNHNKVYRLRGHRIPETSRTAKGYPIKNFINLQADEKVLTIISIKEYLENQSLFFISKKGIVRKSAPASFELINRNGKLAFGLNDGDELATVILVNDDEDIFIASSDGKTIRILNSKIRTSKSRTAIGVKGMNVKDGFVVGATTSTDENQLFVISTKGKGKLTPVSLFRTTGRGGQGVYTLKTSDKTGILHSIISVVGDEDVLVTSEKGIVIRTSLEKIRSIGRTGSGVRLIRLADNDLVASVEILPHSVELEDSLDEIEEEKEEEKE